MANAEELGLRQFATARFLEERVGRGVDGEDDRVLKVLELTSKPRWDDHEDIFVASIFPLVEHAGWFALGVQLGYFETVKLLEKRQLEVIRDGADKARAGRWPSWLRQFALDLTQGDLPKPIKMELSSGDPAIIATFQAALILAKDFVDPLIDSFHWSLACDDSFLDRWQGIVRGAELFDAIENPVPEQLNGLWPAQSMALAIAGFMKVMDLVSVFESIFPDQLLGMGGTAESGRQSEQEALKDSNFPIRIELGRATANLLTWRMNLRDERTVFRLRRISDAFREVCLSEFGGDSQIQWSASQSSAELLRLLTYWRDSTERENENNIPNLQPFADLSEGRANASFDREV